MVEAISQALGLSVPPHTPHAISVSLPTWRDNVGYEEGEARVVNSMVSGYPRFFIHLSIQKLATLCEQKYNLGGDQCMLFPTKKIAEECRTFIQQRSVVLGLPTNARLVHLFICPEEVQNGGDLRQTPAKSGAGSKDCADLHIVLFRADAFPIAKEFWQHTGLGISSRLAERCLALLPKDTAAVVRRPASPAGGPLPVKGHNRHYSAMKNPSPSTGLRAGDVQRAATTDDLSPDSVYLEERYGRNLPFSAAAFAKHALRSRVAGVLVGDSHGPLSEELFVGPSTRGISTVAVDDVFLYPTGMSAIWSAHSIARATRPPAKCVCFGFPYTDTLKILQKWGPGCHFLGFGLDSDIDELEKILEDEATKDPTKPPILALFTEFPSNPLLRSANLPRLRELADNYDFLIVIDETIGNFVNVQVLPYADILVSSLTKVFSGASNVMGGSLTLNPQSRHYATLKHYLAETFEDVYFDEDAIFMERNSRDFKRRIRAIDANAEAICDLLRARSLASGAPSPAIKEVFYPKYTTRENYDRCRITGVDPEDGRTGGFGGLFSLTFTSMAASKAFFDALPCYKGPSLGTNFTLACPFTILAHFGELDWAAQYGVEEGLVRVSVGLEDSRTLVTSFEAALRAAEATLAEPS